MKYWSTDPLTTEGLSVPDALELLAKWIRANREVEFISPMFKTWTVVDKDWFLFKDRIYRAKPAKPRVREHYNILDTKYDVVELTPEVIASGKRDGWLD